MNVLDYQSIYIIFISISFIIILLTIVNSYSCIFAMWQNNSNISNLIKKGLALDSLGNYTQAITYLDQALRIDPKYTAA